MADRKVYLENKPLENALSGYLDKLALAGALQPGETETVEVEEALGRVTAEPVYAATSAPHYHAAAVDGVAVQAVATFGASETTPVALSLGSQAVVVDTGDPLPDEFDAVVMIEDVHFAGKEKVEVIAAVAPWQHVRVIGEDMVASEMILSANHQLRPVDLGGILAGGLTQVKVRPRPRVALVPTGTELVQPGAELYPGAIIEFNSRILAGMVADWGGEPLRLDITPDVYGSLRQVIDEACDKADIVVINAGSSAGREDFTAALVEELGELCVHGVAIKPGKPVILGIVRGKPVVGIPGYPVSAVLTSELFVRPLVYRKLGLAETEREKVPATVSRKTVSPLGAEEFVRVKLGQVGDKMIATPMARGAGVVMSLIRADGVLRIPRFSEGYQAGDTVDVELWRGLPEIKNTTVTIGSHDLTLDVIGNHLRRLFPGRSLSSAHVGSLGGLVALKRQEAHFAGIHLLDEVTGEYNITYLERMLPGQSLVLVNLAYRQQGLMVAPGNPKGISSLGDLTRPGIRYVNRQKGAGTRLLLDHKLKEAGIDPGSICGYDREEFTHMAVGAAVRAGSADAGLGILAAARALGLGFVLVGEERYDLCIPRVYWESPYIESIMAVIRNLAFKEDVGSFVGYDLRDCGKVMWES